jgi:hypothetical protein
LQQKFPAGRRAMPVTGNTRRSTARESLPRQAKNLFDKSGSASSPAPMASPEKKSFSPVWLVIDLLLCAGFFAFLFSVVKTHVQSLDPRTINFWGAMTAGCLTGVFWLALQMVKTVFRFQTGKRQ